MRSNLLGAMLYAPLIGISRRHPTMHHAIAMSQVSEGWERGTFHAVCGKRSLRLVGFDGIAALWPPAVRDAPVPRCRDCYTAVRPKRPRTRWTPPQ